MAAEAPATFKVGQFTFARPAAWKWIEAGGMRKAQLQIGEGKSQGEVVFFEFPAGQGGEVKANIDRWLGQFQEPREKLQSKTEKVPGKVPVTYVQAEGTYMSGMPGAPKTAMPNYALQGAIAEAPGGNIFIRLTGPAALVKSSQAEFKKMVETAVSGK